MRQIHGRDSSPRIRQPAGRSSLRSDVYQRGAIQPLTFNRHDGVEKAPDAVRSFAHPAEIPALIHPDSSACHHEQGQQRIGAMDSDCLMAECDQAVTIEMRAED